MESSYLTINEFVILFRPKVFVYTRNGARIYLIPQLPATFFATPASQVIRARTMQKKLLEDTKKATIATLLNTFFGPLTITT